MKTTKCILSLLLLVTCARAQSASEPRWAGSFAQQGDAVLKGALGRKVAGVAVWTGQVCAGDQAVDLDAGAVLEAMHRAGLIAFDGLSLDALLTRSQAKSPAALLASTAEIVTLGGAMFTSSGVAEITDKQRQTYGFGLAAASGLSKWLASKLGSRSLDPTKLRALELPDTIRLNGPRSCWRGSVLGATAEAKTVFIKGE